MKAALISMLIFAIGLVIVAVIKGPETLSAGVRASAGQLLKFAPVLIYPLTDLG